MVRGVEIHIRFLKSIPPDNDSDNPVSYTHLDMLKKAFPGYKAQMTPSRMGRYIADFALNGADLFNGKIIPVTTSVP